MDAPLKRSSFPFVPPEFLTGGAPIVVLAPHPDDESLACGGLLCHAFAQAGAHVVCMTDGSASHPASLEWPPARLAAERRRELSLAIRRLGGTEADMTWLGHPDGWLGAREQDGLVATVAAICRARGATRLFAPALEDHHEDHRSTARIARRVAFEQPDLALFSYPLWCRWDDPDLAARIARHGPVALDSAPWRTAKRAAIAAHGTQAGLVVRDDPEGFRMSRDFIDFFVNTPELYWKAPE